MDLTINSRVNKLANHAFECTDIIWLDTIPNCIKDNFFQNKNYIHFFQFS
jgi:hypothetical protein